MDKPPDGRPDSLSRGKRGQPVPLTANWHFNAMEGRRSCTPYLLCRRQGPPLNPVAGRRDKGIITEVIGRSQVFRIARSHELIGDSDQRRSHSSMRSSTAFSSGKKIQLWRDSSSFLNRISFNWADAHLTAVPGRRMTTALH